MQVTYGLLGPFQHGRGYQEPLQGVTPAAGANFVYKVPGSAWQRLVSAAFTLTTSSHVANRYVTITYATAQGLVYGGDGSGVAITASQTAQPFYAATNGGTAAGALATPLLFPLSGVFLPSGTVVTIQVSNIDTADQLDTIGLLFETFETGEAGYPIGGMDTSVYRQWAETLAD